MQQTETQQQDDRSPHDCPRAAMRVRRWQYQRERVSPAETFATHPVFGAPEYAPAAKEVA